MNSIVFKIKQYLDHKGIATSAAEKEIGVSNGTLSKPFKANTTIKTNTLKKFLRKYNDINTEWLLTGKGEMLKREILSFSSTKKVENTFSDFIAHSKEEKLILMENIDLHKKLNTILEEKVQKLEEEIKDLKKENEVLKKQNLS